MVLVVLAVLVVLVSAQTPPLEKCGYAVSCFSRKIVTCGLRTKTRLRFTKRAQVLGIIDSLSQGSVANPAEATDELASVLLENIEVDAKLDSSERISEDDSHKSPILDGS